MGTPPRPPRPPALLAEQGNIEDRAASWPPTPSGQTVASSPWVSWFSQGAPGRRGGHAHGSRIRIRLERREGWGSAAAGSATVTRSSENLLEAGILFLTLASPSACSGNGWFGAKGFTSFLISTPVKWERHPSKGCWEGGTVPGTEHVLSKFPFNSELGLIHLIGHGEAEADATGPI